MQNGENRNPRRPDDMEDEVWKARHHCAPHVAVNDWTCFREVADGLKALAHGDEELVSQTTAL